MASAAKVLSVGLGDLVSARNAALRIAGFEVVAAISIEDVFQECGPARFDIAIVGHAFSIHERTEFVRCIQGILRLPVILIAEGEIFAGMRADSQIGVDAPPEDLISAIHRVIDEKRSPVVRFDRTGQRRHEPKRPC
jgi:hypothetical protein